MALLAVEAMLGLAGAPMPPPLVAIMFRAVGRAGPTGSSRGPRWEGEWLWPGVLTTEPAAAVEGAAVAPGAGEDGATSVDTCGAAAA